MFCSLLSSFALVWVILLVCVILLVHTKGSTVITGMQNLLISVDICGEMSEQMSWRSFKTHSCHVPVHTLCVSIAKQPDPMFVYTVKGAYT